MREIDKMITMTTAHITPESGKWLTEEGKDCLDPGPLTVYPKGCFGWFICVPEPEDFDDLEGSVPKDIIACLKYALGNDCKWLCLDSDGSRCGLPTYEW